jgi:hypothetical protein
MKEATLWLATSTEKMYGSTWRARRSTGGAVGWKERTLETWTRERRTGSTGVTQRRARHGRQRPKKKGAAVVWKSWRIVSWKTMPGLLVGVRTHTLV